MSSIRSNRRSGHWLQPLGLAVALAIYWPTAGCISHNAQMEQCDSPVPTDATAPQTPTTMPQDTAVASESATIGTSVEGRPIACRILGDGPDVTLFIATIHGDEFAGASLLQRLGDYLAERPDLLDGRRVVLIPLANPDGFAYRTRHNARRVDLNRNFPAGNWVRNGHSGECPLSEPESQALHDLLHLHQPHRVITIHETLACIDFDGPAEPLARAMAVHSDLPVRQLGGLPGSLGSYFSRAFDRPIVTIELRRFAHRIREDDLWNCYREMLLAAVTFEDNKIADASE